MRITNSFWVCITTALLVFSCKNTAEQAKNGTDVQPAGASKDTMETTALKQIVDNIRNAAKSSLKNDVIMLGDTVIKLQIAVEMNEQQAGKWVYAGSTNTTINTGKETVIKVSTIGVGDSPAEARNVFIQEWFAVFGVPFVSMLDRTHAIEIPGYKLYAGLMGIRGILPAHSWLSGDEEMTRKIIPAIEPFLQGNAGKFSSVDIKLLIGKNGITDGECRLNNEVSPALLNSLRPLPWPAADGQFMFKQFYLVTANP